MKLDYNPVKSQTQFSCALYFTSCGFFREKIGDLRDAARRYWMRRSRIIGVIDRNLTTMLLAKGHTVRALVRREDERADSP